MRFNRVRGQSHLIAEFFAIVVAVLVALLIDEWRADRAYWEQEVEAVTRLVDEIKVTNSNRIRQGLRAYESRERGLLLLQEVLTSPTGSFPDSLSIVDFLGDLGWNPMPDFATATFDDLRSSGNTGLISNRGVRSTLLSYYSSVERSLNDTRADAVWRELDAVLGSFVPYDAWRVAREGMQFGGGDEHPAVAAEPIIRSMRASPRLIEQLDMALRESYGGWSRTRVLELDNRGTWTRVDEYLAELVAR